MKMVGGWLVRMALKAGFPVTTLKSMLLQSLCHHHPHQLHQLDALLLLSRLLKRLTQWLALVTA
jgi:hypothetical protein